MLSTLALLFERVISSQLYNCIMPFIPQSQYGFLKGSGAQDCGTTIALFATQALELRQECRVVSLKVLLTVFSGMVCCSILVVLVSVARLLLYFCLICPTGIYM